MATGPARSDKVTCPACGVEIERRDAREYDRYGNRWERAGKTFEYLCKQCDGEMCHHPRDGLEDTLVSVGTAHVTVSEFVAAYYHEIRMEERTRG